MRGLSSTIETDIKKYESIFDPRNKWAISSNDISIMNNKKIIKLTLVGGRNLFDFSKEVIHKIKNNSGLF